MVFGVSRIPHPHHASSDMFQMFLEVPAANGSEKEEKIWFFMVS
jgi:hypothetical protein